jgi:hypothetical protein
MQGMQAAIVRPSYESLNEEADSFKTSDRPLKSYNDNLIAYQKEVDKLSAAMIELMSRATNPVSSFRIQSSKLEEVLEPFFAFFAADRPFAEVSRLAVVSRKRFLTMPSRPT